MKLRIFTEPQQGASYQTLRAVAQTAEELGFDAFFRSDHYLQVLDLTDLDHLALIASDVAPQV